MEPTKCNPGETPCAGTCITIISLGYTISDTQNRWEPLASLIRGDPLITIIIEQPSSPWPYYIAAHSSSS